MIFHTAETPALHAPTAPDFPATAPPDLTIVKQALASVSRKLPRTLAAQTREELFSAGCLAWMRLQTRATTVPTATADTHANTLSRGEAFLRIRGAMLDELRRADPLGRRRRRELRLVAQTITTLEHEFHRAPLIPEIAARAALSCSRVSEALAHLEADTELPSLEAIPDTAPTPTAHAEKNETAETVLRLLETLPAKQATAVRLTVLEDLTLAEAAAQLGVSTERTRQLRDAGLARLRSLL